LFFCGALLDWQAPRRQPQPVFRGERRSGMRESPAEIAEILADLRTRHRDLDDAIASMAGSASVNQLQLTRLKKRKLRLKDQIAWYESRMIPDLDA